MNMLKSITSTDVLEVLVNIKLGKLWDWSEKDVIRINAFINAQI